MSHKRLTIAVISPAGIPDPAGLEQGLSLIRSWGHEVITGPPRRSKVAIYGGR